MPYFPRPSSASSLDAQQAIQFVCVLMLTLSGCGAPGADRPDFSGVWKLDAARSDFGPVPGPSEATHVIHHEEPRLRLTTDSAGFMGERHTELELLTDGSEQTHTVDGNPRVTRT
jgi:hypothetical protein